MTDPPPVVSLLEPNVFDIRSAKLALLGFATVSDEPSPRPCWIKGRMVRDLSVCYEASFELWNISHFRILPLVPLSYLGLWRGNDKTGVCLFEFEMGGIPQRLRDDYTTELVNEFCTRLFMPELAEDLS